MAEERAEIAAGYILLPKGRPRKDADNEEARRNKRLCNDE